MRFTRLTVAVVAAVVLACVLGAARPATAAAAGCTLSAPIFDPGNASSLVSTGAECQNGTGWRLVVTPQYESGGSWINFLRHNVGTDAQVAMPQDACAGQDHYTNASFHSILVSWDDGGTCAALGGNDQNTADIPHSLVPTPCGAGAPNNERVKFTFRNSNDNGPIGNPISVNAKAC